MKPTKLSTGLGAALAGLALGTAAALAQTDTSTTGEAASETAAATEAPAVEPTIDTSLADVNGVPLTLGEVVTLRRELPEQYQQLPDEVLFDGLVEQMIDQMLLAEQAQKIGLDKADAVVLSKRIQERAILARVYLEAETLSRVTPEAVEARYQSQYVDVEPVEEVRASHILVETEELAIDLKAQIDAGVEFAALAAEHGTDGTRDRGGELGWFAKSDMVPEFADAAFAMEAGTVSDPVKTAFGWHLIKLDERRDRQPPALEEVRSALTGELIEEAQREIMAELRENSTIVMPEQKLPPSSIRNDALLDAAE